MHSIEGVGLNPAGGMELQPVAKTRMSSIVVADLPSEKFTNKRKKKKNKFSIYHHRTLFPNSTGNVERQRLPHLSWAN